MTSEEIHTIFEQYHIIFDTWPVETGLDGINLGNPNFETLEFQSSHACGQRS
jgi:hypothetical protein